MDQSTIEVDTTMNVKEQLQDFTSINQRAIDLLNAWDHEDTEEQGETLEFLMRALD